METRHIIKLVTVCLWWFRPYIWLISGRTFGLFTALHLVPAAVHLLPTAVHKCYLNMLCCHKRCNGCLLCLHSWPVFIDEVDGIQGNIPKSWHLSCNKSSQYVSQCCRVPQQNLIFIWVFLRTSSRTIAHKIFIGHLTAIRSEVSIIQITLIFSFMQSCTSIPTIFEC